MRQLLLLALVALVGVGCGRSNSDVQVVRIWHQKDGGERAFFQEAVARFNASQDTIRVESLYKETEELRNHYTFAAIGGKGPDMIYGPADNVGILGLTETIRPLDDVLPPEFIASFSVEGLLRWEGGIVAVSDQLGNHLALVYNRALISEPPKTLDELVELAQSLTTPAAPGQPRQYGLTWNYTEPFFFIPFLTGFGGWVLDEEGNPTLDNDATVRAIQFVLDLRDRYGVIPSESDYNIAETLFKEGRAAMIINGPWAWSGYGDAGVDYAVAPLPINSETGLWLAPMVSAKGYSINTSVTEERLPGVLAVLAHFTGDEMQTEMTRTLGTIPTRRAVLGSPVMQENPVVPASLEQAARGRAMPTAPQLRQVWDGMRGPYQLVMNGNVDAQTGARLMQRESEKRISDTFLSARPEGIDGSNYWIFLAVLVVGGVYVWRRRSRGKQSAVAA
ncbi:hypothetical protein BH23BAC4_BH23BAC4_10080 [soil metagenome]